MVAAYGAVPFPMVDGGSLPDALSACADALPWRPLSACPQAGGSGCYGQWATLKGLEEQQLVGSERVPVKDVTSELLLHLLPVSNSCLSPGIKPPTPLHTLHSGEDVLSAYISSFFPSAPL